MPSTTWFLDNSPLDRTAEPTTQCPVSHAPQGPQLTQAAGAEAVVGPWLGLGLVAVENLLYQLLHREARAAVPIATGPFDTMDCRERGGGSLSRAEELGTCNHFFNSNPALLAELCLSCGRKSYSALSISVKGLQILACWFQLACQPQWHVRQPVFY